LKGTALSDPYPEFVSIVPASPSNNKATSAAVEELKAASNARWAAGEERIALTESHMGLSALTGLDHHLRWDGRESLKAGFDKVGNLRIHLLM